MGSAQGSDSLDNCITNLSEILSQEGPLSTSDLTTRREYILCPNTVFATGVGTVQGDITGGQYPLVVRSNAVVKCGADGKSTNNCVITSGQYAIFLNTYAFFGDQHMHNVEFHGLTIQNMMHNGDVPIIIRQNKGSVKFVDLVYRNNAAAPGFLVMQEALDSTTTPTTRRGPGRLFSVDDTQDFFHRRLNDNAVADFRRCTNQDTNQDWFTVTIQDSLFEDNQHVPGSNVNALIDGGKPLQITTEDGTVTTTISRTIWRNNNFDGIVPVENLFGLAVWHQSCGKLTITDNCFEGNKFSGRSGIVYSDTTSIELSGNYIDTSTSASTSALQCPFVAHIQGELGQPFKLASCLGNFDASSCMARSPTPAPTIVVIDGGFCFPGNALVQRLIQNDDKRIDDDNDNMSATIPMRDLRIGDKVLVGENGRYEEVYSFGHRNPATQAKFLRFNQQLEISEHHMVWVDGGFAPASTVKLGSILRQVVSGNGEEKETVIVTSITTVQREGVFSPFTLSGTIVVNGYMASSFVGFQNSGVFNAFGIEFSYQWMAQQSQLPHRWAYQYLGMTEEEYNQEGISTWVALPYQWSLWLTEQQQQQQQHTNAVITTMVFMLPILFIFSSFALLENLVELGSNIIFTTIVLSAVVLFLSSSKMLVCRKKQSKKQI